MTTQQDERAELIRDLREYASDSGYNHIDYRDTMLKAAALLEADAKGGEAACKMCGGSGWVPNRDAEGNRVWLPFMNDAIPCGCGALAKRIAAEKSTRPQQAAQVPLTDGQELWLWRNGDHMLAFQHLYPCVSPGGDPMTLGEPAGRAVFRVSHNRARSA